MNLVPCLIFVAMMASLTLAAAHCPSSCSCQTVRGRLSVECAIFSPVKLRKVLSAMSEREMNIHKFYMESDGILSLGPKLLGNMSVDKFYVNGMNIAAISPDVFEDQEEDLLKVGIDNAQMSAIPIAPIMNLVRLKQYEFRYTRGVRVIQECAFCPLKNPESLQRLDLRGNNVEVIEKDAFVTLIRLKWLRLWDNNIKHIPYNIFPPNTGHLTYIDMEANELTHLPHHLIAPLPFSAYISLNHNMIENIPHKSIDNIVKRNITIKLYHNQVDCHCGFLQIAERNQKGHLWHGRNDTCSKPYRLAKVRIQDLRKKDFIHCK